MGGIKEVGGRAARLRLAAAVAEDIVGIRLGSAVVRFGQAIEVVIQVGPGLGGAADVLGLRRTPALVVPRIKVAAEDSRVEQVLALLEAAVLEPALGGSLARVQALLDQSSAGVEDEADGLPIGRDDAGQTPDGVVGEAGDVAVAVFDPCQPSAGGGSGQIVKERVSRALRNSMRAARNNRTRLLLLF